MSPVQLEQWRKFIQAVQSKPNDYTAQDQYLAELLESILDDRTKILADWLLAEARITSLEAKLRECAAQIEYYRSVHRHSE